MSALPTTFFGWVGFLIWIKYGGLFLRGAGVTLLVAHQRHGDGLRDRPAGGHCCARSARRPGRDAWFKQCAD